MGRILWRVLLRVNCSRLQKIVDDDDEDNDNDDDNKILLAQELEAVD